MVDGLCYIRKHWSCFRMQYLVIVTIITTYLYIGSIVNNTFLSPGCIYHFFFYGVKWVCAFRSMTTWPRCQELLPDVIIIISMTNQVSWIIYCCCNRDQLFRVCNLNLRNMSLIVVFPIICKWLKPPYAHASYGNMWR